MKTAFAFVLYVLCLDLALAVENQPAREANVVAHWRFNDETATSVADLSGNDFVGIVKNQARFEKGVRGRALAFDPENKSCVVIGRELGDLGGQLSVEIIFKATIPQDNAHLLNATYGKDGFRVLIDRKHYLVWQVPDPSVSRVFSNACLSSAPILDEQWYHMFGTYDGMFLRIYLNGKETGSLVVASTYDIGTTRKLVLGSFDEKGEIGAFQGLLDEVKIYKRCLQPAEIEAKWKSVRDAMEHVQGDGARDSHDVLTATVDVMNGGTPFPVDLFGINIDTEGGDPPGRFLEMLRLAGPRVVRFPGGLVGNFYHWADTLGPVESRKSQWTCYRETTGTFVPRTGAAEFLTMLRELNAKGVVTVNVADGTAEEAAAWVAFCRGKKNDARVIGTDTKGADWKTVDYWAIRRHELTGVEAAISVPYWELGNEITVEPEKLLSFATKMKRVDPDIRLGIVAHNDETMKRFAEKKDFKTKVGTLENEKALEGELGRAIDFLVFHSYSGQPRFQYGIMMWSNGTRVGGFECPEEGDYEIAVSAEGRGISPEIIALNLVPKISIGIDDATLSTVTLSKERATYKVRSRLSKGSHALKVTYLNDVYEPDKKLSTDVFLIRAFSVTGAGRDLKAEFPEEISKNDFREGLAEQHDELISMDRYCEKRAPHLGIAMTEYNRIIGECWDLSAGLYLAELIRMCVEVPRVRTAEVWESISWNFGMRFATGEAVNERPVFYVFQMLRELQDRKVPFVMKSDDRDVRVLVTRHSKTDKVAVLVINLGGAERRLRLVSSTKRAEVTFDEKKSIHHSDSSANNEIVGIDAKDGKARLVRGKTRQVALKSETLQATEDPFVIPAYSVSLLLGRITKNHEKS